MSNTKTIEPVISRMYSPVSGMGGNSSPPPAGGGVLASRRFLAATPTVV
ncbi:MAG TPA: hypothetical protein VHC21_02325 [Candidatus Saccharimonadales bacterium]|nr:hypothetical protein [Candidatus Saccharimonadales bacterium]